MTTGLTRPVTRTASAIFRRSGIGIALGIVGCRSTFGTGTGICGTGSTLPFAELISFICLADFRPLAASLLDKRARVADHLVANVETFFHFYKLIVRQAKFQLTLFDLGVFLHPTKEFAAQFHDGRDENRDDIF